MSNTAEAHYLSQALDARQLVSEALRLKEYTALTQAERYWLEDVLVRKDFVLRTLDQKRADEAAMARFEQDFESFKEIAAMTGERLPIRREDIYPQLHDATARTAFDRHYLYHPAWAARVLAKTRPIEHVDIGSILHSLRFCPPSCRSGSTTAALQPLNWTDFPLARWILLHCHSTTKALSPCPACT